MTFVAVRCGAALRAAVVPAGERRHLFFGGRSWPLALMDTLHVGGEGEEVEGGLRAPMPGKVVALAVQPGATVEKGAPLLVLEAMKMEHTIHAPRKGVVKAASRAVREYLDALDANNPAGPNSDPDEPPSGDSTPPKNISPTDPGARWTAVLGGPAFYAYSTNYLIDLDAGIILDVEATPAHRTEEVGATRTMIEREFDLTPKRLVADTAYGAAPMLNWIVNKKKIEPHIPVWEKSLREDGTFGRPDARTSNSTNAPTHMSAPGQEADEYRASHQRGNCSL